MSGVFRSIGRAIKGVVEGIVDIVRGVVNFVGDIVGFVFNPMGSFDVPTPGNVPADQQAQGVTITKNGTNVAIPVVYGFRRVGGSLIFAESKGDRNEYLIVAVAICEGEIEGVNRVIIDDVELPIPTSFGTTGSSQTYVHGQRYTINSGRFNGLVEMQIYNGKETNSPTDSQVLSGDYSPGGDTHWVPKDRRLPGVAYAAFQFKYPRVSTQEDQDNNPWKGGMPKMQFDVLGKKVYDVSGHTVGNETLAADYGSLSKRYHGNTTQDQGSQNVSGVVGTNPANCLLDYLMNTRYGCGIPKEQIDAESFRNVAMKCKRRQNYYTDNGRQFNGQILTLNAVIDTNIKLMDNVKVLVGGNRGIMPYVGGRYKLKMEDGGTSFDDPTETDVQITWEVNSEYIVGGITLDGERKNTKLNEVIVNYIDPDRDFTNQQIVYSEDGDQGLDNNEKLSKEFTFHTVTNSIMAETTARHIYKKSRNQRSVSFTGTQELIALEVGDIITVTDTVLNLIDQQFRVAAIKLNANFTVDISAVEHDATIYDYIEGTPYVVVPQIFRPDEISLRPRVRSVPVDPIGIVPPVSPDPDSADESQIDNPIPDPVDVPLSTISEFDADPGENRVLIKKSDGNYIQKGQGFPINFSETKGLATVRDSSQGSTHNYVTVNGYNIIENVSFVDDDWIFYRDSFDRGTSGLASPKKTGGIYVVLAQPKHVGITTIRIKRFDTQGNLLDEFNYPARAGDLVYISNNYQNSNLENFQIRWVQNVNGQDIEHEDGSIIDTTVVTYYDSVRGKNIRGRNIEAYVNHAFQNVEQVLLGNAAYVPANGDDFTFTVDLGA